jgi:hypothetical protein
LALIDRFEIERAKQRIVEGTSPPRAVASP